jgi:hypothetical protein
MAAAPLPDVIPGLLLHLDGLIVTVFAPHHAP